MPNILPLFIGLRYTRAKRRNSFISFVSLFAFLSMALGVFALIVVLSVMNGFDHELKQRILRVVPHGFLSSEEPLRHWQDLASQLDSFPSVVGSAPFVEGHGLLSFAGGVQGVQIQGIDPQAESAVSVIDQHMVVGSTDELVAGEYRLIMGSLLARYFGLAVGDKISLTMPEVSITPAGIFPRSKRFTLIGVFEAGAQVDQTLALIHIADGQKLLRRGGAVDGLRLKFTDIYEAPQQLEEIVEQLGPGYVGKDWSQTQGSLFQAVKMEKTVVGLMLGIIIAVAAFNIVTSLVMMIAEKRSDIAVLRTLGMPVNGIVAIFIVQGLTLGLVGIGIGAVTGVTVAVLLPDIMVWMEQTAGLRLFDPAVYFVSYLPSLWHWQDTLWVCAGSLVISLLATIYPAYRASQIAPAEALRYNV